MIILNLQVITQFQNKIHNNFHKNFLIYNQIETKQSIWKQSQKQQNRNKQPPQQKSAKEQTS